MRINATELQAIRTTLGAVDPRGRIYLFGSRTDNQRRGGDIDLFLEATKPIDLKTALLLQYRLTAACDIGAKVGRAILAADGQTSPGVHKVALEELIDSPLLRDGLLLVNGEVVLSPSA